MDRYKQILAEMEKIFEAKSRDYSGQEPMKDLKEVADLGIEPWVGVVVRMVHKFGRLKQLTKDNNPACQESIRDTLIDIANYSIITIMLYEEYQNARMSGGMQSADKIRNVENESLCE